MHHVNINVASRNGGQRQGISLLEVLFSIFVLAVGLLGLASMIPVGKHQVTEATHADRGTAIGMAAHREIKIRDLMDSETWVMYNYAASNANRNLNYVRAGSATPGVAFVIDPLGVSTNVAGSLDSQFSVFPYGPPNFLTTPDFARLPRISIGDLDQILSTNVPLPASTALADRIFRSLDDRAFELPDDDTLRPRNMADATGVPLATQLQSEGNYSWLIMVTPPTFVGGPSTVSVVVFYKRDLNAAASSATSPPSERSVYLDMVGGGLGSAMGGDAQLRETSSTSVQSAEKVLKVRPNQWILVSGQISSSGATVHKWYRVVSTSEMLSTSSPWIVDVTLSGPDWNASGFRDVDGAGGQTMFATICDGVIGVYEKTIQLDEPSLWTSH